MIGADQIADVEDGLAELDIQTTPLLDSRSFLGLSGLPRDEAVALLTRVVEIGIDFKYNERFSAPRNQPALDSIAVEPLPLTGLRIDELLEAVRRDYLAHMPNFASPRFAGFPDAGNSVAGAVGALLSELVNVNMINAEFCSRGATEMEIALVRWLRELIGYRVSSSAPESAFEVGGIPTGGGTMANFAAVLLARARAFPNVRERGLSAAGLRVLLPESIGHYTVPASLAWAGLGTDAALFAPVKNYRYDLDRLPAVLSECRSRGETVMMAVAYAGDSRSMTIDDLTGVAQVVRSHFPDAWLHCDGCHGTSLLFSQSQRPRLSGLSEYDSVMMDPHKVLAVPYANSFLLIRDPAQVASISTESELILKQARSLGQITPVAGSRAFQSLRTWMLLKAHGTQGIGEMIDSRLANAKTFARIVDETPGVVRLNDVSINSVMFTIDPEGQDGNFSPAAAERSARATENAYQGLLRTAEGYLHSFRIPDSANRLGLGNSHVHPVLRYMSGNALLDATDMRQLILRCIELSAVSGDE